MAALSPRPIEIGDTRQLTTLRDSYDAVVLAAERRGADAFWCPQTVLLKWHEIWTGQMIRPDSFNRHLKRLQELGKVWTKAVPLWTDGKPGTWFFLSQADYLSSGKSIAAPEHRRVMSELARFDLDALQAEWCDGECCNGKPFILDNVIAH